MTAGFVLFCGFGGAVVHLLLQRLPARSPHAFLPSRWRPWTALTAGLLCAATAWRLGPSWDLAAFLLLPVFGVLLAAIDLRAQLLPNAVLAPFAAGTGVLLLPAFIADGSWAGPLGALLGAVGMFALYLALALLRPGDLGMGDVKLAGVLGLLAGSAGPTLWLGTAAGGFVVGGLAAAGLLLAGRASRTTLFPFGPAMLLGAFLAALIWA